MVEELQVPCNDSSGVSSHLISLDIYTLLHTAYSTALSIVDLLTPFLLLLLYTVTTSPLPLSLPLSGYGDGDVACFTKRLDVLSREGYSELTCISDDTVATSESASGTGTGAGWGAKHLKGSQPLPLPLPGYTVVGRLVNESKEESKKKTRLLDRGSPAKPHPLTAESLALCAEVKAQLMALVTL